MSKITCEYCGTAYKSTAKECPLCGNQNPQLDENTPEENELSRKSGKFSAKGAAGEHPVFEEPLSEEEEEERYYQRQQAKNRARITCSVLGVIALILGLYIGYRFLRPHLSTPAPRPSQATTTPIACTNLIVEQSELTLAAAGEKQTIHVRLEPADTSDKVAFSVADSGIATVDASGVVTAVAQGETTVSIACGAFRKVCKIHCSFADSQPSSDPTNDTTPVDSSNWSLTSEDFTLFYAGDSATLRVNGLADEVVTWESDDPKIATVDGGKVTAVSSGTTTIHAKIGGADLPCTVRCKFEDSSAGNGKLSHTDVSIDVDEGFNISLTVNGVKEEPVWASEDESICTVDATGRVTGKKSGKTYITAEYEGATYTCVVYVR